MLIVKCFENITCRNSIGSLKNYENNLGGKFMKQSKSLLTILTLTILLSLSLLSNYAFNSNEYEQQLKDISNSNRSQEVIYYGFSEDDIALELNIDKLKDVEYLYSIGLTDNDIHVIKISSTNYYVIRIIDGFPYVTLVKNSTEIIGLPIVSIPQKHNYDIVPNQDMLNLINSGMQNDNYMVLQQTLDTTEEKIEYIDNILKMFDIQCVELKVSENPIVKGMDTNWIAYDIITEKGNQYVLIVRKHDKDFTALIDNNNRQLTGILDNGILPETYNLIN